MGVPPNHPNHPFIDGFSIINHPASLVYHHLWNPPIYCCIMLSINHWLIHQNIKFTYIYPILTLFSTVGWIFLVGGFETCFFPYIGNNNPNWLIFFRGVETTNQICCMMWYPPNHWFSHPSWCAHLATSHWNSRQNRNVHRDGKPIHFRSCFRSRQTIGFMMQICDN